MRTTLHTACSDPEARLHAPLRESRVPRKPEASYKSKEDRAFRFLTELDRRVSPSFRPLSSSVAIASRVGPVSFFRAGLQRQQSLVLSSNFRPRLTIVTVVALGSHQVNKGGPNCINPSTLVSNPAISSTSNLALIHLINDCSLLQVSVRISIRMYSTKVSLQQQDKALASSTRQKQQQKEEQQQQEQTLHGAPSAPNDRACGTTMTATLAKMARTQMTMETPTV